MYAIMQGCAILFVTLYTMDDGMDDDQNYKGNVGGSLYVSTVYIFQALVILVNLRLVFEANELTFFTWFFLFGTIGCFYIAFWAISNWEWLQSPDFGVFPLLMLYPTNYLLLFFTCISLIFVDIGGRRFSLEMEK